jgi:hypothetical protein
MRTMSRIAVLAILTALLVAWPSPADGPDQPPSVDPEWAFLPVKAVTVPTVKGLTRTHIDAFLLAKLEPLKLAFAPPADRATWLRRVTYDLTGLPPTAAERAAYLADESPDADAKVVDRLLASKHFGERQATWWLDVVRYADSDGFKADDPRPNAWRYRDYVIQSFNDDKPFDRFVTEQIAGDEKYANDPAAIIATGFLRHYPDEYNAVNLEQRRQEILNDITDTTGAAFLGLTLGCAKCHDHKFDPVGISDYYRIQAFFAGYFPAAPMLLTGTARAEYDAKRKAWEEKTAEARKAIDEIERPYRVKDSNKQRERHVDYVHLYDKPVKDRTPYEHQIATMVAAQVDEFKMTPSKMKGPEKEKWEGMKKRVAEADGLKPPPAPTAMAMGEVGPVPPPTYILKRGNWRFRDEETKPGYLSAIDDRDEDNITPTATTSGRRTKLAEWIASEKNPLTARVFVNRVWQHLFGTGLVATPADFGVAGDKPTHPGLLDWLATEFVTKKWSVKSLYRTIALSTAYRQSGDAGDLARSLDPDNKLLARMPRKRLDGESLRDAVLAVSGQLNLKAGGPGIYPDLPAEMKVANWKPTAEPAERNRRSIYVAVKRNMRYPLFALFDASDRVETCSRRFQTTTAPQALALLNDSLVLGYAQAFAARVTKEAGPVFDNQVEHAFRLALGRGPDTEEKAAVAKFAKAADESRRLADVCHAVLNLNEFLFVD